MAAEDLLWLAWQAEKDGRLGTRDALLTLAVAESGPDDAVWADRCRRRLIARMPDHWFASFSTLGQALDDWRVVKGLATIRAAFPPVRVKHLLLRTAALRGPYTGRRQPLSQVLNNLFGSSIEPRRSWTELHDSARALASNEAQKVEASDDPEALNSPSDEIPALPFPGNEAVPAPQSGVLDGTGSPESVFNFYLTVLLAIAILLASVTRPAAQDKAA